MRRIFICSHGQNGVEAIVEAAKCAPREAELVVAVRRLACLEVIDHFERGSITFRQLWRACEYTGDPKQQLAVCSSPRNLEETLHVTRTNFAAVFVP